MISRTKNKNNKDYGGRGIKCLWKKFEDFRDDMYPAYLQHAKQFGEKNTSIDRIDSDGHYTKENCRWATREIQNSNYSRNLLIKYGGRLKTLKQWSDEIGINYPTLHARLQRGWSTKKTLTYHQTT